VKTFFFLLGFEMRNVQIFSFLIFVSFHFLDSFFFNSISPKFYLHAKILILFYFAQMIKNAMFTILESPTHTLTKHVSRPTKVRASVPTHPILNNHPPNFQRNMLWPRARRNFPFSFNRIISLICRSLSFSIG
jgi:hypothetical protein